MKREVNRWLLVGVALMLIFTTISAEAGQRRMAWRARRAARLHCCVPVRVAYCRPVVVQYGCCVIDGCVVDSGYGKSAPHAGDTYEGSELAPVPAEPPADYPEPPPDAELRFEDDAPTTPPPPPPPAPAERSPSDLRPERPMTPAPQANEQPSAREPAEPALEEPASPAPETPAPESPDAEMPAPDSDASPFDDLELDELDLEERDTPADEELRFEDLFEGLPAEPTE